MRPALVLLLASGILAAQPRYGRYHKHNFTTALGAGLPRADLLASFKDSVGVTFGYGYRFHENFQVETGLDTIFHAAEVRDFYESPVGDLRIRDYQFMLPIGGRAILPLARGRLQFYGGGGAAWLRYQESIRQPFGEAYFRIDCVPCRSRGGWGYYGLVGASVALDRRQHFRLGVTAKMYRAKTSGDAFGTLPPFTTRDRWLNVFGEFGVSF